jgi:MFS family permease
MQPCETLYAVHSLRDRLLAPVVPLTDTFRNAGLRRLQLAWAGSLLGSWAYVVALWVYAYHHGGASAVALISVVRMVPSALVAPFAAMLADRFARRHVMIGSNVVRAALMAAATAVIATGGPAWLVYLIATVNTVSGSPFRPAQAALLPALAKTPAELTAANAASSTLESVGTFLGPAIGGIVLAATNLETVFALNGASFVWSALLVLGIRIDERVAERRRSGRIGRHEFTAGFRTILADRAVTMLVALYALQTLVAGAVGVFVVVASLRLLHGGSATVGYLNGAIGAGGMVGGFLALVLAARGRLAADFGVGLALFGAPLALIGGVPHLVPALLAMAVIGIGNSLVDVSAVTLLQRVVPDDVLGRVLGAVWGLMLGSIGVGAFLAPLLIHVFGVRGGLVIGAAILPAAALLSARQLRRLDVVALPPTLTGLLAGVEIFAPLPPVTLEQLATKLAEVRMPAGATVIRAGDPGDRFYVVGEGEVEIEGKVFGPGSSFGEIALLRDVPRTATVVARTDVVLYALERDDFLSAVTGHEPSSAAAGAVIARRLGELRADLTTEDGAT